jgi:hypothetical protein
MIFILLDQVFVALWSASCSSLFLPMQNLSYTLPQHQFQQQQHQDWLRHQQQNGGIMGGCTAMQWCCSTAVAPSSGHRQLTTCL